MTQLNQQGRVVKVVSVSQGRVFSAGAGDAAWVEATNNTSPLRTPPLNFSGLVSSTSLNQDLWFVDGTNYVRFDPEGNTLTTWKAATGKGTIPRDSANNAARLVCTWRGRCVLSGILGDPQNWFMSRISDPTDWDYAPTAIVATQAVAGNNAPAGLVGDVVTGLVPYTDDLLVFGGDHTIYMLRGDPMDGGRIDLVSDQVGFAWGQAWCKDPYGVIYFVSNKTGVYSLVPGQGQPKRISQPVEQLLLDYDLGATTVRLVWDDRYQGFHAFFSPTREPAATTHFFWEARTGAWWQDRFKDPNMDPLCCCTFDGNEPGDRLALVGSWDGYVRCFDPDAVDDDGEDIESEVVLGPITSKDLDEFLCKDLQAVLGEDSGNVSYAVHAGATAEVALSRRPLVSGTWTAGRNLTSLVRASGHALYLKLTGTDPWAMEVIRARIAGQGKVRRRGV